MFISKELPHLLDNFCRILLESRVCVTAVTFLCGGILAGRWVPTRDPSWVLVFLIPTLLYLLLVVKRQRRTRDLDESVGASSGLPRPPVRGSALLFVTGTLLFLLGFYSTANVMRVETDFQPSAAVCSIHATVYKTQGTDNGIRILLLESGYNQSEKTALPGNGRLFLRNNTTSLSAGDRIAFRSRVRKPSNRGNPGEFDWVTYCRNDGIMWLVSVPLPDGLLLIRRGPRWHASSILYDLRESMRSSLERCSGVYLGRWVDEVSVKHARSFLKGIIIGDRREIGYSVRSAFADSGLAHLLAVSGVHVAIVALLTLIAVKVVTLFMPGILLRMPLGKISALASIPAMVIYCMIAGAGASAVRATIMGLVFAVAILTDRRRDSFNSLIVAGFIILLVYPLSLFSKSFQLSFVAVAGILTVSPPLFERLRTALSADYESHGLMRPPQMVRWSKRLIFGVALAIMTSVGATLAVTPLVLQSFHSFPVYTLLANLLADTLLTLALFFGLCGSVIGMLWPSVGNLVLLPADVCSLATIALASLVSALPYSTLKVRHLTTCEFLSLSATVWSLMWVIRKPGRSSAKGAALAFCCLICSVAIASLFREVPAMTITFLNVGKADSAFVKPRGSKGLLIDGGLRSEHFDSGPSVILPFLLWNGTRTIDGMILSHPQMDHMGGLLSVIPHARPRSIWWNPIEPCPPFVKSIIAEAQRFDAQVLPADRNRPPLSFGTAVVRFLNKPCARLPVMESRALNDASVVCRIECDKVAFLFVGDLEASGEEELLGSGMPLAATVLKVGHHGSITSSTQRFLEAVRPQVAVISSELRLTRGGPARGVVGRLQSAGSQVFWTGRDGAVTVQTDGQTVSVTTGK